MQRGFTLIELIITIAVIIGVVALVMGPVTGCDGLGYPRTLSGEVNSLGSRSVFTERRSEQKISVVVHPTHADDKLIQVAGGPSGVAIECLSTRCASLMPNTCHEFACRVDYRLFEPDVVECKHVRETTCDGH